MGYTLCILFSAAFRDGVDNHLVANVFSAIELLGI